MKSNGKYTALEILTAAKVRDPQDAFGFYRVRIGGIAGITRPEHLIKIHGGMQTLSVVVGNEKYELKLEKESEETVISDAAKEVLEAKGREASKAAEELQKAKAEAKKAAEEQK